MKLILSYRMDKHCLTKLHQGFNFNELLKAAADYVAIIPDVLPGNVDCVME